MTMQKKKKNLLYSSVGTVRYDQFGAGEQNQNCVEKIARVKATYGICVEQFLDVSHVKGFSQSLN